MHTMIQGTSTLLWLALLLPAGMAIAADSTYQLENGGTVTVNPETKRATVTKDGVTTPLYDGTHQTKEGSTLIIRQGITTIPQPPVSPPKRKPEVPAEQWEGAPIVGYSPCEKLVRKTCGAQNECASQEGCKLARQLLDMETSERDKSENRSRMTYTSGQCIGAASDTETFPGCSNH